MPALAVSCPTGAVVSTGSMSGPDTWTAYVQCSGAAPGTYSVTSEGATLASAAVDPVVAAEHFAAGFGGIAGTLIVASLVRSILSFLGARS